MSRAVQGAIQCFDVPVRRTYLVMGLTRSLSENNTYPAQSSSCFYFCIMLAADSDRSEAAAPSPLDFA